MLDLNQLQPLLTQLGPWGWAAAAVLGVIQFRRQNRSQPRPPSPVTPAGPTPGPLLPDRPILNEILRRLRERSQNRAFGDAIEPAAGGSPLADLHAAVMVAVESRRAELQAELAALPPTK